MEPFPEDQPQRPPIAPDAAISVILLAVGSTSDAAESVAAWRVHLATLERPFELLLVPFVPLAANPVLDDVRRLTYEPAQGIGPALIAAFRAAQHPLVVLTAADHQFQPTDLAALMRVIDKVDLAVGCRTVLPRSALWRGLAWMVSGLGWLLIGLPLMTTACTPGATPWRRRWVARWLFGVRVSDPQSPFRLARREAVTRIVLQSRGPFALIEQLAKANHLEMILAEEPVAWIPHAALPETVSFATEARTLFRRPDFGPPELHVPAENVPPSPTDAPPASSESGTTAGNEE